MLDVAIGGVAVEGGLVGEGILAAHSRYPKCLFCVDGRVRCPVQPVATFRRHALDLGTWVGRSHHASSHASIQLLAIFVNRRVCESKDVPVSVFQYLIFS